MAGLTPTKFGMRPARAAYGKQSCLSPATFLWYLVVAGPQGGLAVLPIPFDKSEPCRTAITAFEKTNPASKWNLQCFPAGPPIDEEQMHGDTSPDDQRQ